MKKVLSYKILIILFLLTVAGLACKKREPIGPSINDLYGPLVVVTPFEKSSAAYDFSVVKPQVPFYFTAAFSTVKSWTITLKGQTSGATKTITGVSAVIDSTNGRWSGGADDLPSFQKEVIKATLTFQSHKDTLTTSFTSTGKRNPDLKGDVLISDFVYTPIQNYGTGTIPANKWASDFPATGNNETAYGFPDGNAYLVMGPQVPHQGNGSPYVDILTITPSGAMTAPKNGYFPLKDDPTTVYFNLMVYNTGTPTWLQIGFLENGGVAAARTLNIRPDWIGWKLISVKYSDLIPNAGVPGSATNIQSNRVTGVQFILLSNTAIAGLPGPAVKAAFDHATFTHDQPYQP